MKTKNIIQILIIAVLACSTAIFIRQPPITKETKVSSKHHDLYYCPMHPQIIYDHPGRCPICGMDLVKRIKAAPQQESAVAGYTPIALSAQGQQLAGVKTDIVRRGELVKTLSATGQYEGQVYARVFENDLEFIKVGQKAVVDLLAYHQHYEGQVGGIDSSIDETTRTVRVRINLHQINRQQLKDNMFVNVTFPLNLGQALIVPREAVMDTGVRKIVFVQNEGNNFEPREIQTGMETDNGI